MSPQPEQSQIQTDQLARAQAVRDDYAVEVQNAESEFWKAKTRVETARLKLEVADNMLKVISGAPSPAGTPVISVLGRYHGRGLQDSVLDVINGSGREGISIKGIATILQNEGFSYPNAKNFTAAIHTACARLESKNLVVGGKTDDGLRIYLKPD